jgi:microcystin-dependent protein
MANTIITPNMGLPNPVPNIDPGPDYAFNNQACFNVLDQHNHTPGSGVQIPPAGLNINSALPFNGNPATNLQATIFTQQSAFPTNNSLWVGTDGNLYFNDGAGDPSIKITAGGTVNATTSGISSGTATASFIGGVLVVNAAPNTPANIQAGSILLGNNTFGSNYLTLSPPAAMGSNITETLPSIPAATSFMQMDTSGTMTASVPVSQGIDVGNLSPAVIALIAASVPPGVISAYGGASAPAGYLLCDGTSYLQSTYAPLFAAIGAAYGSADGTHFNVPDLRGQFLRGVTGASGNDPDAASRAAMNAGGNTGNNVGSVQGNATAVNGLSISDPGHTHTFNWHSGSAATGNYPLINTESPIANVSSTVANSAATTGISLSSSNSETRPINAYVTFIIKT